MESPNQQDIQPANYIATRFIQTMYFDMQFNYFQGWTELTAIAPGAPDNWESESCELIPYVRYEYTRVSKNKPETSKPTLAEISQAREKVKSFASTAKRKRPALTIIASIVVTNC